MAFTCTATCPHRDQYSNEAQWWGGTQLCLLFYHPTLHNKVANISQPWQSFQLYDSGEERNMMDWCQSSGEPYIPDSKHGLPICQQPPLTTVKTEACSSFMRSCEKTMVSITTGGDIPFLQEENCVFRWAGLAHPSAGRGVKLKSDI